MQAFIAHILLNELKFVDLKLSRVAEENMVQQWFLYVCRHWKKWTCMLTECILRRYLSGRLTPSQLHEWTEKASGCLTIRWSCKTGKDLPPRNASLIPGKVWSRGWAPDSLTWTSSIRAQKLDGHICTGNQDHEGATDSGIPSFLSRCRELLTDALYLWFLSV